MERVKQIFRFKNMLVVECHGEGRRRSGGLVLLWNDSKVDI